jgi:hypothetical protein
LEPDIGIRIGTNVSVAAAHGVVRDTAIKHYRGCGRIWKRCLETTKSVLALAVFPRTLMSRCDP